MTNTTAKMLDKISEAYFEDSKEMAVDKKLNKFMSDYIIGNLPCVGMSRMNVLELGIGNHVWTQKLLDNFHSITTIDGSERLMQFMNGHMKDQNQSSRWQGVVTLFEDYRPTKRFDIVFAVQVLEHVDDAERICRIARESWLAPNGLLVVIVPHALSLHRRLAVCMNIAKHPGELGETDRKLGHVHNFSYLEMQELLIKTGFKVKDKQGMLTKSLPNSFLSMCTEEQLLGLFKLGLEMPIEYAALIYFLAEAT